MAKELDILWIVPHLNEKWAIVKKNIILLDNFSKRRSLKYKIVLADGGSNENCLINLVRECKKIRNLHVFLTLPTLRPTKNKAIRDAIILFKSKYVGIIDSDISNLTDSVLRELALPVIRNKFDISLPSITKSGGRVNRLVCKPLMHLFFEKIDKKIDFPLSGIVFLKSKVILKEVKKADYFWDWGGEIQIIINSAEKNKVHQFHFNKLDSKKRNMESKQEDSYQLMRALIYEAIKGGKLRKIKSPLTNQPRMNTIEEFTLQKIVREVLDDLILNKKRKSNQKYVISRKIDYLRLDLLHQEAINLFLIYIQKLNRRDFIRKCHSKFAEQNSFKNIISLNITNLNDEALKKISKIYNKKMDNLTKTKKIMQYDNRKT